MFKRALQRFWKTGMLSTFLTGLFAVLPIVITIGIMAWVGSVLKGWLGPDSLVGNSLVQTGLQFVTDPTVAAILGWVAVLIAIWLLGALLKSVGKKRIEKMFNTAVERIPLVNILYRPVAQVVELLQRKPTDTMQGMSVVHCAFGGKGGGGFLGLLVSDQVYRFNGQVSQIVYVPTSPVPMSGVVVFATVDSVQRVEMPVDDLLKICLSIGVMSSQVIPKQYVVLPEELDQVKDSLLDLNSHMTGGVDHANLETVGIVEANSK